MNRSLPIFATLRAIGWPPICGCAIVQWVMGAAHLSTTQGHLNPLTHDVIEGMLAFHACRAEQGPASPPAAGYRPDTLRVLFGADAV